MPRMLQAIREAKTSVSIASYIFEALGIGSDFVTELTAAVKRGVEVRVPVDVGGRAGQVLRPEGQSGQQQGGRPECHRGADQVGLGVEGATIGIEVKIVGASSQGDHSCGESSSF